MAKEIIGMMLRICRNCLLLAAASDISKSTCNFLISKFEVAIASPEMGEGYIGHVRYIFETVPPPSAS